MEQTRAFFQSFFDEKRYKVSLEFSVHCGCSMCPCSPGFKVYVETLIPGEEIRAYFRSKDDMRINVWMDLKKKIAHGWKPKGIFDLTYGFKNSKTENALFEPLVDFVKAEYAKTPGEEDKKEKTIWFKIK
jgi:hypothetical protein